MPQSPELAAGEGFTYEGNVAAFYLVALLAEANAPGVYGRKVVCVSVQQRDFGEPLDDVIIDFEDIEENRARLSLQVKQSLVISNGATNSDFRAIIRDCWGTLNKSDFRENTDRYGFAVGNIAMAKGRALENLCEFARESPTVEHFEARFANGGNANAEHKKIKSDIESLVSEVKETDCTAEDIHRFLAHFVFIQFNFLCEGATEPSEAINRIRDCLTPNDENKAPIVWSHMIALSRESAGKSGQFDRPRLVREISIIAHLCVATSLRSDLETITMLTNSYVSLIADDIGETRLERIPLLDEVNGKLKEARIVQICGLPGSGKSVLIKRLVQQAMENGPVIFLKAEQLEGSCWISHATSNGLSGASLEKLLVEIGTVGTPILFIDAIDRVEKRSQPIIIDLLRTINNSPLLDNWKIIVTLRNNNIELLRNWLGDFIRTMPVNKTDVTQLTDEECEILAKSKPHLRPLLFGPSNVKEIVRRPFFAKVVNQSYVRDPEISDFTPQSELDLIQNWWVRGGYCETGQSALNRQQILLDLAENFSRQLSQPILLSKLRSYSHIEELKADGILQNAREGISIRFSHDIFFEWSFFYVLAERGLEWISEIKACGEPPALARVVELTSQWEYIEKNNWKKFLDLTEQTGIRSQWQRAWLMGPLGIIQFESDEEQFTNVVFADDFRYFKKLLVWFQAERTIPSPWVLAGELPSDQREKIAYYLSWPSDFSSWRRLIHFILRMISNIPQKLFPEIIAIFEVWQNFFANFKNVTSTALLKQCDKWLQSIESIDICKWDDEDYVYWHEIRNLDDFEKSLRHILVKSAQSEPTLVCTYIQHVVDSSKIYSNTFKDIIEVSPLVSKSLPKSVVDLCLAYIQEDLPDVQFAKQREQRYFITGFDHHDWERLSIKSDYNLFGPPSPLREPFNTLFQTAPTEALRLLRELCNHAMTAWRQLHQYRHDRLEKTPIPLELIFPWGTQKFWGTDREYLWFRSSWAPDVIGCGFMALDEWCFNELSRGRSADELIKQVVKGNDCIAILGVAAMLALETETVSDTTLPLFTSQRLLAADSNRMANEMTSSTVQRIGFHRSADTPHILAIEHMNERSVRKKQLMWMVPRFVFAEKPLCQLACTTIANFKDNLPFQYEEHRSLPAAQEHLTTQAIEFAELVDQKNYKTYRVKDNPDQLAIVHESPSAALPENIAKVEKATTFLQHSAYWAWADKSLEENELQSTYAIDDVINLAKASDSSDLFVDSTSTDDDLELQKLQGMVSAIAAIVLVFREKRNSEDLEWAHDVLQRAINLPEKFGFMWTPESIILWHPSIYVAKGLAADIRESSATDNTVNSLLGLIGHPLNAVALTALEEACKLWDKDAKLTWSALFLGFSLCHIPPRSPDQSNKFHEPFHTPEEIAQAVDVAFSYYKSDEEWIALPLPPVAWVKVAQDSCSQKQPSYDEYEASDAIHESDIWCEPDGFWYSKFASEILQRVPYKGILSSNAKSSFLDFLTGSLDWTIQKNAPPWVKPGHRDRQPTRIFEWTHSIGSQLGCAAGLLRLSEYHTRWINPILELEDENCWALLLPLTNAYICAYIYDEPVIPQDAITTIDLCIQRLLQEKLFTSQTYGDSRLPGVHLPDLVRTLMFVSVEKASMSSRYVNGNWSEINLILPLIDRFIRVAGWNRNVITSFLTLCDRAKENYPAEVFANQVLYVLNAENEILPDWRGAFILSNIAELVQYFANRDAPLELVLAQKFLRILDMMVDMGDRRSAALELGESFRDIRLSQLSVD